MKRTEAKVRVLKTLESSPPPPARRIQQLARSCNNHETRADTICIKAPTTVPMGGVRAWLDKANAALDSAFNGRRAVRLLGRMVVPPTFHAEVNVDNLDTIRLVSSDLV